MKFSAAALLFVLVFFQAPGSTWATSFPQPAHVSMFQLIATPERFDGRVISVVGFLALGQEHDGLFAYEADAIHLLNSNGVSVNISKEMRERKPSLDRKYVLLVGTFKKTDKYQFSRGTIANITRYQFWSDPKNPISQRLKELPGVGPYPQ